MDKVVSCCGVICSECEYFEKSCKGCTDIGGKPFWLEFTGQSICDIYDCCINRNRYKHCGQCLDLPCDFYEQDDPTKSKQENNETFQKQLAQLAVMEKEDGLNCPCKRAKCERHGDCKACREHHNSGKRNIIPACDRQRMKAERNSHQKK